MRLTPPVIWAADQGWNPLKQWTLYLRELAIDEVENLGVTKDVFDCIDLSNNFLKELQNFPPLARLTTLVAANNLIARIDSSVGQALSQLDTLLLPRNNIASLADIAALKGCSKLTHLNLLHNPVTRRAHYRLFTVYTLPQLVMLDCQKIRRSERQAAETLFASEEGRLLLAAMQKAQHVSLAAPALGIAGTAVAGSSASAETPAALPAAGPAGAAARPAFTPAQLNAIRTAIQSASTPDEIDRLEKFLKLGKLPPELRAAEQRTAAADAE